MSPANLAKRRAFSTFDVAPSASPAAGVVDFDELMIDWGEIPAGSIAQIYWPAVSAAQVLELADSRYASHSLGKADAHTVQCLTTRRLCYVPIPANAGPKFAGLLSVELPASITHGQTYSVTVRRVTTYTPPPPYVPPPLQSPDVEAHAAAAAPARGSRGATRGSPPVGGGKPGSDGQPIPHDTTMTSWRTISGAFQINIPVQHPSETQPFAENTLSIFKWRLSVTLPGNRWRPVLIRYIDYLSRQIDANGGNASTIPASQTGLPYKPRPGGGEGHGGHCPDEPPRGEPLCIEGKVVAIAYDCFGDFEGFWLACCENETFIKTGERRVEEVVRRALDERRRVEARLSRATDRLIGLVVRG